VGRGESGDPLNTYAAAGLAAPTPRAPASAEGAPAKANANWVDPFPLPKSCFNANGSFNQENIVFEQKKRAAVIGKKFGTKFDVSETEHYLLFSNADHEMTATFRQWCEPLYANLQRLLGMDPKERLWDGKCIVLLFNARQEFLDYATGFDNVDAGRWQAYYQSENSSPSYPVCVHLCFPAGAMPLKALQDLFTHEGTHVFFRNYKGRGRLPLWLEEGLSEYMMVYNDATLRPVKRAPAETAARAGKSIAELLEYPSTAVLTHEEYSVCYTLADYLFSASGPRMKTFIESLKRKAPQDSALQTSFGFTLVGLQDRWRTTLAADAAATKRR
jgi:hypothetical protein